MEVKIHLANCEITEKLSENCTCDSPFIGVSSCDLFKELGMSQEDAEKGERGLNAVIRRQQMIIDNKA